MPDDEKMSLFEMLMIAVLILILIFGAFLPTKKPFEPESSAQHQQ